MRAISSADSLPRWTAWRTCAAISLSALAFAGPDAAGLRNVSGRLRAESEICVGKYAGQSTDTLTRLCARRRSWYSTSDRATTACLVTVYAENPGGEMSPAT